MGGGAILHPVGTLCSQQGKSMLGTDNSEFLVSLQINTWVSKSHLLTEKLYSLLSYFATGVLLCYLLSQVFHPFILPSFLLSPVLLALCFRRDASSL